MGGLVGGNGLPLEVPNLGAIGQVDPATWVQQSILRGAGITQGGRGTVETQPGTVYVLDKIDITVMAMPPMIHILSIIGRLGGDDGQQIAIPWHAVRTLHA